MFLTAFISCSNFIDNTSKTDLNVPDNASKIKSTDSVYFYSFENNMQGWEKDGTDLELGDGEINWDIKPTNRIAYYGQYSLDYLLENYNDAGKIWIEKGFDVTPEKRYKVDVEYQFCSADYSQINTFYILTGVTTYDPEVYGDLTVQGNTYNEGIQDYTWLGKTYSFYITSTSDGEIYIHIGIWGSWETPRKYFFDGVLITIEEL